MLSNYSKTLWSIVKLEWSEGKRFLRKNCKLLLPSRNFCHRLGKITLHSKTWTLIKKYQFDTVIFFRRTLRPRHEHLEKDGPWECEADRCYYRHCVAKSSTACRSNWSSSSRDRSTARWPFCIANTRSLPSTDQSWFDGRTWQCELPLSLLEWPSCD